MSEVNSCAFTAIRFVTPALTRARCCIQCHKGPIGREYLCSATERNSCAIATIVAVAEANGIACTDFDNHERPIVGEDLPAPAARSLASAAKVVMTPTFEHMMHVALRVGYSLQDQKRTRGGEDLLDAPEISSVAFAAILAITPALAPACRCIQRQKRPICREYVRDASEINSFTADATPTPRKLVRRIHGRKARRVAKMWVAPLNQIPAQSPPYSGSPQHWARPVIGFPTSTA
jgi:hypothetical protein